MEAMHLARALVNGNSSKAELQGLFLKAVNRHNALMQRSMQNRGCDRHLLGLKLLAAEKGEKLHALYEDPAYKIRYIYFAAIFVHDGSRHFNVTPQNFSVEPRQIFLSPQVFVVIPQLLEVALLS